MLGVTSLPGWTPHPDVWLVVSVSRFAGGGSGLQTQVWARGEDGAWRVTAAHVTGRTRALDTSVWRTVGDPLYQGAWEGPLVGLRVAVKDLGPILEGATHVAFEGLDSVTRHGHTFGFGASIDLARALAGDVLLADRMNAYEQWGKPLPEALHGEWERGKARIADGMERTEDGAPVVTVG